VPAPLIHSNSLVVLSLAPLLTHDSRTALAQRLLT